MHFRIEYTDDELKNEVWKDIPNYEGIYEASSLGRIRTNINKTSSSAKFKIRHWEQRVLKYKSNNENTYKTGYRVDLWKNGKPKTYLVARLVASAFIRNELNNRKLTVNHIDGNRLDNRIENLEWCSLSENILKGFETGLYSTQQLVKITNKKTQQTFILRSMAVANKFINKHSNYLRERISKGQFENELFKWEILRG